MVPFDVSSFFSQYYVIGLTNFQSGIDTITSYLALVAGVMVFKTYLINKSWRFTSYLSVIVTSVLGLMWLLAYYNTGGLRNGWFTIFVDMDKSPSPMAYRKFCIRWLLLNCRSRAWKLQPMS